MNPVAREMNASQMWRTGRWGVAIHPVMVSRNSNHTAKAKQGNPSIFGKIIIKCDPIIFGGSEKLMEGIGR